MEKIKKYCQRNIYVWIVYKPFYARVFQCRLNLRIIVRVRISDCLCVCMMCGYIYIYVYINWDSLDTPPPLLPHVDDIVWPTPSPPSRPSLLSSANSHPRRLIKNILLYHAHWKTYWTWSTRLSSGCCFFITYLFAPRYHLLTMLQCIIKKKRGGYDWFIDWFNGINGMSTRLGLFLAYKLQNCIHYMLHLTFFE